MQGARRRENWITPPSIIEKLGPFDLDPCGEVKQPWKTATVTYFSNGLERPWFGRVWLNPPFGELKKWIQRLAEHNNGIALLPARTETTAFFDHVWPKATAICFIKGRIRFFYPDGRPARYKLPEPCCLIAYGTVNRNRLIQSNLGITIDIQTCSVWQLK